MLSIGKAGYKERVQSIVRTVRTICSGIAKIPGLKLMTPVGHQFMVVCFGSNELDIYRIKDVMAETGGWTLNDLQNPAAVHLCVTLPVASRGAAEFLADLQTSVEKVRKEGNCNAKQGTAGIYGSVGSVPSGSIEYLLNVFVDTTLTP
jgi:sphinganine-1-phosphate aldolase